MIVQMIMQIIHPQNLHHPIKLRIYQIQIKTNHFTIINTRIQKIKYMPLKKWKNQIL